MEPIAKNREPSRRLQVQGPDEEFLRALSDEYATDLLRYASRLTNDKKQAEDIVQETLVRAWKQADKLGTDERPLRPWLFTVVAHLAIDRHRAELVRPDEVGGQVLENKIDSFDLDRTIQAWEISNALSLLSASHREILIETYYRGRSTAEAARILGIPVGTVKSRVYHALRSLRLILEEQGLAP